MKSALVSGCVLLSVVVLAGCSDNAPSFPVGDGGWQVVLEAVGIPDDPRVEYPVLIEIDAHVISLTDGGRPADGSVVSFGTSAGAAFDNDQSEIEIGTLAGAAATTLRVDRPGSFVVSAEYVEASTIASISFDVGL